MKTLLTLLGLCCVALAFAGLFLPVLPTVPFVLLAAACFAKSSERFHRWMIDHPRFGPIIRQWRTDRSMPRRAKITAVSTIAVSGAISLLMIEGLMLRVMVALLLLIPTVIVLSLPTREAAGEVEKGS